MRLKIKKGITVSIFVIMFLYLFAHISYLFRNIRPTFLAYEAEKPNSIDFVMVGSSTVYRYFDPMYAWNEYGFTSFDYSTDSIPAGVLVSAINELYKTQHPKVVAVETRQFVSSCWHSEIDGGFRNFTDSIPFSANRMKAIEYYAKLNDISFEDVVSAYFDLIYYHTNIDQLSKSSNWDFSDCKLDDVTISNYYKGYLPVDRVIRYFDFELPDQTGGGILSLNLKNVIATYYNLPRNRTFRYC